MLVTNHPYGQRIDHVNSARAIYKDMSRSIRPLLDRLDLGVITPDGEFERLFGRRSSKKRRIFKGKIKCNYYMYTKLQILSISKENKRGIISRDIEVNLCLKFGFRSASPGKAPWIS